jgi:ribosome-associated protein
MEKSFEEIVLDLAKLTEDSKAQDVTVLDVSELNSWTDYFVIATVSSVTQWQGIYKAIKDFAKENELEIRQTQGKNSQSGEWNLVDLGRVVVHLMSADARNFYELEKLWHAAKKLK